MTTLDTKYIELVDQVVFNGEYREGRNGGTFMLPGLVLKHNMSQGFPVLTTRKIAFSGIAGELAAFLEGATSLARFKELGCNYWDMNANGKDDLGRIYGAQWREFRSIEGKVDQLSMLIDGLIKDPFSRRHVMTTWHPAELEGMCLPPCHLLNQYICHETGLVDSIVYMRSVDLCLGLPSDLALYGLLLHLVCAALPDAMPGQLIFMLGDAHVYNNHLPAWEIQRTREPHFLPKLSLWRRKLEGFRASDAQLINYISWEALRYELN